MGPITVYNGIEIYLTVDGEFYCNPDTNSSNYEDKLLVSTELLNIKRNIDNFYGERIINGDRYYIISVSNTSIKPVQIVRRHGDNIHFDNGTDTDRHYSMRTLHPSYVDSQPEFKDLKVILDKLKETELELERLEVLMQQLTDEANAKVDCLHMVDVRSKLRVK